MQLRIVLKREYVWLKLYLLEEGRQAISSYQLDIRIWLLTQATFKFPREDNGQPKVTLVTLGSSDMNQDAPTWQDNTWLYLNEELQVKIVSGSKNIRLEENLKDQD